MKCLFCDELIQDNAERFIIDYSAGVEDGRRFVGALHMMCAQMVFGRGNYEALMDVLVEG